MSSLGKVPLLMGAIGGFSALDKVRTHLFFALRGWEKVKQGACPSQRHVILKSSGLLGGNEQVLVITQNSLHYSTGSDALCPHPLTNHQVHVVQACWRIVLWWVFWLPYQPKPPEIPLFSLKYLEKGKLMQQSVLCVIIPEQTIPQTGREKQRNLLDKILISNLLVLGCIIIYPQNFQHILQKITIST